MFRKRDFVAALTAASAVVVLPGLARAQVQEHHDDGDDEIVAADSVLAGATLQLTVKGMSCPLCARTLEKRLAELPGVAAVTVRAADGIVHIREEKGRRLTEAALRQTVESAGFSADSVRRLGS